MRFYTIWSYFADDTDDDGWTLDMKIHLLQLFLEYRSGPPVERYWDKIAKHFPKFSTEEIRQKVCRPSIGSDYLYFFCFIFSS